MDIGICRETWMYREINRVTDKGMSDRSEKIIVIL